MKELSNEELEDDTQIFHMWEPFNFKIKDNYKYICHNWVFNMISSFLTLVIYPILYVFNKAFLGFKIENKEKFLEEINKALKNEKTIHMYPEGALWPYYEKIRKFKNGAFKIAAKAEVPIVPILYVLKEPKGIYKLYKKKKCIHAVILDPIYPNKDIDMWKRAEEMKERAHKIMNDYQNFIDKNRK